MLVNFCDKSLRTDVSCSTISTEGYDVSNLVKNSETGFLAYSCIKPPVHIDFNFICNIQLSHVNVWPQVGAQKSIGFQLSVKSSDNSSHPYTILSTAFLKQQDLGLTLYRRDVSHYLDISTPTNFIQHCIKPLNIANYVNSLRLSILKTDNSVPGLNKIEIWGRVSPKCGKDVAMNVTALWMNRENNTIAPVFSTINVPDQAVVSSNKAKEQRNSIDKNMLNVPEDFLDPITCEIMTQPIILPSGKIIDQRTLEKHEQTEAIWGRPASDPFTGIRFNNVYKPLVAVPLKARIDKFLLENCNNEEIKLMPRILGSKTVAKEQNIQIITCTTVSDTKSNSSNDLKRTLPRESNPNKAKRSFHGHVLPVATLRNTGIRKRSVVRPVTNSTASVDQTNSDALEKSTAFHEKINSSEMPICKCCKNGIFYKLPCEHVICRKALLLLTEMKCSLCEKEFQSSDPRRFHL